MNRSEIYEPPAALRDLGVALHPVMDMTSPAHTDQNGNPRVWNGNPIGHSPYEWIPGETKANITPATYAKEDKLIRAAYSLVMGRNLNCAPASN